MNLRGVAGPAFAQWRKQTRSHAQCQRHSKVVRIQSLPVPTAKRGKSNTPVLFLDVISVFVAFNFRGCFGLVLLLTFLPLLPHSEPSFVCPSFLSAFFLSCLPASLPSFLPSFPVRCGLDGRPQHNWLNVHSPLSWPWNLLTLQLPRPPGTTQASPRSTAQSIATSEHFCLCWLTQLVLQNGDGSSTLTSAAEEFSPSKLLLPRSWATLFPSKLDTFAVSFKFNVML